MLPVRYRHPVLGDAEIEGIARACHTAEGLRGELGPLRRAPQWDTPCYAVFLADDLPAQARGVVPGLATFCVDRLDGHVWSLEEQRTLRRRTRYTRAR